MTNLECFISCGLTASAFAVVLHGIPSHSLQAVLSAALSMTLGPAFFPTLPTDYRIAKRRKVLATAESRHVLTARLHQELISKDAVALQDGCSAPVC